ncbi:DnaB-like helicase N-terminal domain-containing protein, partial [Streptococcus pseudopneumoniae]|uniref:DnaB-like helicase N-terminal domain-containing protein n=1 Tax=Streptococcus pseudopneumoniae TaxID=257758 RepID=UPI0018B06B0F|nr:hypothetical protein [Streptococcus pseudopneumoniae]
MTDLRETLLPPPHSLDAERAVIGAVLLDAGAHDRVADLLAIDDFYTAQNR